MKNLSKLFVAACLGVIALDAAMDLKFMVDEAKARNGACDCGCDGTCECDNGCDHGKDASATDFADE